MRRTTILAILAWAGTALAAGGPAPAPAPVRPDYPASKHGGTYMFNYYLPPAPSSSAWAPAWSPDGRWIAIAMQGSIWKVDPGTGTAFEVSYNSKYHSSPTWSPDGRWIVYTADDDGSSIQLEAVNVETGETHALTADTHIYTDPVFSPDGTKLAYVSTKPNGYFNVYVRPIKDGQWAGEEVPVSQDNNYGSARLYFGPWDMHTQPSWLPDGNSLVLVSNRDAALGSGNLWRVPVEANGMARATLVLQEETLYRTRPDVSREGKRIIFSSSRGAADQFNHLYLIPVGGGEPYKLTFGEYDEFHPRWSPDGERIAYISNEGGLPQLWVLETYGGARTHVRIQSRRWRRPMGIVQVRVVDQATGASTAARIYADGADGKAYMPHDAYARIASTRMTRRLNGHIFHSVGDFTLEAPVGKLSLEAVKGFEYHPTSAEVDVSVGGVAHVTLTLRRLTDMAAKGWFSGSTHAHMNYAGNLRNTPAHMMLMGRAEDLDVVNILAANKDSRVFDHQYFEKGGGEHSSSIGQDDVKVIVGQEYRPPFWGHVFYIGLRDHLISPFTAGYKGSALESLYPSNTDMFKKALAQGAAVGYVHAFGGDRDPLEGSLGGAKGFPVDAALGTIHAVEWSGSSRATYTVLHHALNNDLRIAPVGGEDANTSLHRHTALGSVRTYAYTGSSFTAERWRDAIKAGRTFFSNGPLLEFTVDGRLPGESVQLASPKRLAFKAEVWSYMPLTRVMIHRNGQVWKEIPLSKDKMHAQLLEQVEVSDSAWYSLSAEGAPAFAPVDPSFPQAGTSAIRVYVGDGKIRNKESADYFIRWLDRLQGMAEQWPGWGSQAEKEHVFAQIAEARQRYEQFAKEAR
jgi:dipeptidyl aminopeptidase/acylaminoacyl peptidase